MADWIKVQLLENSYYGRSRHEKCKILMLKPAKEIIVLNPGSSMQGTFTHHTELCQVYSNVLVKFDRWMVTNFSDTSVRRVENHKSIEYAGWGYFVHKH